MSSLTSPLTLDGSHNPDGGGRSSPAQDGSGSRSRVLPPSGPLSCCSAPAGVSRLRLHGKPVFCSGCSGGGAAGGTCCCPDGALLRGTQRLDARFHVHPFGACCGSAAGSAAGSSYTGSATTAPVAALATPSAMRAIVS